MIKLKRFIHPGLAISVLGHFGLLALGLLFVGANALNSTPTEPTAAILPEATVVDIVPPNEAPRFEGTPSELKSSGSESRLKSDSATAVPQPGPPKPTAQPRQQPQQPQQPAKNPQRDTRAAKAPPPPAPSETAHAETAPPAPAQTETAQPDTAPPDAAQPNTDTKQTSAPPPAPPPSEETADQPPTAETFAQLALVGGRLGGGFAAPAIDTNQASDDFTVAFRERVSSCSTLPAGIDRNDKIEVALQVSFNADGTLASPPRPLRPITSSKAQAVMESAINALQKCQPYTMLPAKRYKQWRTIDLVFYPMNFAGQ